MKPMPWRRLPPFPTPLPSFGEACGYNNDGLSFANRAERLPGVVPRRREDLGTPTSAFAIPVLSSFLSQVSDWIRPQSPRGTRALVQVHYPTTHRRLYTLLPGDRIDPPTLATGLPRADRHLPSEYTEPVAHQLRVASSFRARATYPASINGPSLLPSVLDKKTTALASGDLFITIPTFDDIVPTSLWECLHNAAQRTAPLTPGWAAAQRTIHLNPGLDMPQSPTCSQWRFRPAEMLMQARRPARLTTPLPSSTRADEGDTQTGDTHLPEHGRK